MDMLIGGPWQPAASGRAEEVTSPFDGAVTEGWSRRQLETELEAWNARRQSRRP